MHNPVPTPGQQLTITMGRDLSLLASRRGFWWLTTAWAVIAGVVFFAYLNDFLAIQPTLRAKNFRYGVTDIVLVPYLKTLAALALVLMAGLCSRGFYHEHFAPFALLYRSSGQSAVMLVVGRWLTAAVLAVGILVVLAVPVVSAELFFDYNGRRIAFTLAAIFMLLWVVGMLAMVCSQRFSHSVLVVLLVLLWVGGSELLTRLLSEPPWLAAVLAFFSPWSHITHITNGIVTLSDIMFFVFLPTLLSLLAWRQYQNTFLTTQ